VLNDPEVYQPQTQLHKSLGRRKFFILKTPKPVWTAIKEKLMVRKAQQTRRISLMGEGVNRTIPMGEKVKSESSYPKGICEKFMINQFGLYYIQILINIYYTYRLTKQWKLADRVCL
jgi:hypothetical protein